MTKYTFILIYKITQNCLKWIAFAIVDMTTTIATIVNFPQKDQHSMTQLLINSNYFAENLESNHHCKQYLDLKAYSVTTYYQILVKLNNSIKERFRKVLFIENIVACYFNTNSFLAMKKTTSRHK